MREEMRCHDNRCEVRQHCLRWLLRDDPGPADHPAHHGMTLRPAWMCNDEPCPNAEIGNEQSD
jgi:hypothetical protein